MHFFDTSSWSKIFLCSRLAKNAVFMIWFWHLQCKEKVKISISSFSAKIVISYIRIIKSFLFKEQNEGKKKRKGLQLAIFLWLWTAKSTFLLLLLLHLFLILPFSVLLYPFSADSGQKVRKLGKAKMVLSSTITVCCWSIF